MESNKKILVIKYATAFVNVFYDHLAPDALPAIKATAQTLNSIPSLRFFLQLSSLDDRFKMQKLKTLCLHEQCLPSCFNQLLDLLVAHKRSSLFAPVLQKIYELTLQRQSTELFNVSSSDPLSDKQKEALEEFLKRKTGLKILCSYSINKKLIAGIRAQSDNLLWEHSLKNYLTKLKFSLID